MKVIPAIIAPTTPFGRHLREIVTALLSCGIVGSAIYEVITKAGQASELTGWAGMIVGVYFGAHVTNPPEVKPPADRGDG